MFNSLCTLRTSKAEFEADRYVQKYLEVNEMTFEEAGIMFRFVNECTRVAKAAASIAAIGMTNFKICENKVKQ